MSVLNKTNIIRTSVNNMKSKVGLPLSASLSELEAKVSTGGGGYDGELPRNAYISAKGLNNKQIEITVTNIDAMADGTRIYYEPKQEATIPGDKYIDIPMPNKTGIIDNLQSDTKYGLRSTSYVLHSGDKKAFNTSKTVSTSIYALTLPGAGGLTNKFTITVPEEITSNSYAYILEYDPYNDILYLGANDTLLYKLKPDFSWEQLTIPTDCATSALVATDIGLFCGSTNTSTTCKLYRYADGSWINMGISAEYNDIRKLSCGQYLALMYTTSGTNTSSYVYKLSNSMTSFTSLRSHYTYENKKAIITDFGDTVYISGNYYLHSGTKGNSLIHYKPSTGVATTVTGITDTIYFGNLTKVYPIGDNLYITGCHGEYSYSGPYIAVLENETTLRAYSTSSEYWWLDSMAINPLSGSVIIPYGEATLYGMVYNPLTNTFAGNTNTSFGSSVKIIGSLIYKNRLFMYGVGYEYSWTQYNGTHVRIYNEDDTFISLSVGSSSYRPHMFIDDDGVLYRLDSALRKFDDSTNTFVTTGLTMPSGTSSKSYRMIQIENRRYFSQANASGPLLYIKNGVVTQLGTGQYTRGVKLDDSHDLLIPDSGSYNQLIINTNTLEVTNTGLPGGSKFFNDYVVDNTNHKLYKDGEVDLNISENHSFSPTTVVPTDSTEIQNKNNTFDYMYYTSSSTGAALVYTKSYAQEE